MVDIEVSFTLEEIIQLKMLADHQQTSVEHCAKTTLMEQCRRLLSQYKEDAKVEQAPVQETN